MCVWRCDNAVMAPAGGREARRWHYRCNRMSFLIAVNGDSFACAK
jgi:hypothetical protein